MRHSSTHHLGTAVRTPEGTVAAPAPPRGAAAAEGQGTRPDLIMAITPSWCVHRIAFGAELGCFENKFGSGHTGTEETRPSPTSHSGHARTDRQTNARKRPVSRFAGSGTAPRGASHPARGHSPSLLSPDRTPTPLLQVLSSKLPRTGCFSRPSGPGHIRSGPHLEASTSSQAAAPAQQSPERADNSRT